MQTPVEPLVQFKDIRKAFGGVHAVDGVNLNLYAGDVVVVVGHNSAGKTMKMKMLAGAFPVDSGEIHVMGRKVNLRSPAEAQQQGIETIHQTLALADNLDA